MESDARAHIWADRILIWAGGSGIYPDSTQNLPRSCPDTPGIWADRMWIWADGSGIYPDSTQNLPRSCPDAPGIWAEHTMSGSGRIVPAPTLLHAVGVLSCPVPHCAPARPSHVHTSATREFTSSKAWSWPARPRGGGGGGGG
eukprot:gene8584-biopygen7632